MDICKLFDDLKYFRIDFSETISHEEAGFIEEMIQEAFVPGLTHTTKKPIIHPDEIKIECDHSKTYALMHLDCKDQKGLLAYIIYLFDEIGIDIATAKIHTLKNRVKDMFLIEKNGNFCHKDCKSLNTEGMTQRESPLSKVINCMITKLSVN
jgi:[protein-PII] uridylyltransferase